MTEVNQREHKVTKDLVGQGQAAKELLTKHARLVGGALIVAGAVVSLALALNKVRKLALWLVPVALYFAGAVLITNLLKDRGAMIGETE